MKHITAKILIVFLLLAQFGLAQHDAVHSAVHYQITSGDHGHEGEHSPGKADEGCQVYLAAKCFSHALVAQLDVIQPIEVTAKTNPVFVQARFSEFTPASYHARGPPAFLI